jgi:cell volume regulation protein A
MIDDLAILIAGALLAGGLAASLLASRLRLPALLLFLALGMLVGSDGAGLIAFDDYELARTIGVVALALILFEGGLTSGIAEIRPVLRPAISLALVGTLLTALVTGLGAMWMLDLTALEALLLGSILASTDAAAVFSVLRASTLERRLARTLEGEAGLNDPVAILLVLGFIEWIELPGYGLADMVRLFASELGIGLGMGLAVGWLAVQAFRRIRVDNAGLYPVASFAAAALGYGGAASLGGSGFLAVYLVGLFLGTANVPAKRTVATFHQGLAWVAQIALFLTLGLLVFPSQLPQALVPGTVVALVLVFLARPLATLVATAVDRFSFRERLVLGWAGLRGGVPVVLAIFPVVAGVPRSLEFFNIAFFAVVLSTLLQGLTVERLARALGLTTSEPALPQPLAETGVIRRLGAEVVEFPVGPDDAIIGHRVRELGLPRDALVNVIVRDGSAIPPRGSTRIEAGDRLHLLVREEVAWGFEPLLERWRRGPWPSAESRRPPLRTTPVVFTSRPWREEDGRPDSPRTVQGAAVVEQLRTRRDRPGALVSLADGRFAITGPTLAVGSPSHLQRYARQRLERAETDLERAWWQEAIGALAR